LLSAHPRGVENSQDVTAKTSDTDLTGTKFGTTRLSPAELVRLVQAITPEDRAAFLKALRDQRRCSVSAGRNRWVACKGAGKDKAEETCGKNSTGLGTAGEGESEDGRAGKIACGKNSTSDRQTSRVLPRRKGSSQRLQKRTFCPVDSCPRPLFPSPCCIAGPRQVSRCKRALPARRQEGIVSAVSTTAKCRELSRFHLDGLPLGGGFADWLRWRHVKLLISNSPSSQPR